MSDMGQIDDDPVKQWIASLGFEWSDIGNEYYHPEHDSPVVTVSKAGAAFFHQITKAAVLAGQIQILSKLEYDDDGEPVLVADQIRFLKKKLAEQQQLTKETE